MTSPLVKAGIVTALVVALGFTAYMYLSPGRNEQPAPPVAAPEAPPPTPPPIEHPVAAPPAEPPLPTLENSDELFLARVGSIFDLKRYGEQLILESVINRFVVIVDNLDRRGVPQRVMLTQPVKGSFAVKPAGEDRYVLDESNFRRYEPFMTMIAAVDTSAFVNLYSNFYPLFQQAYEEIGYPHGYFNDRLVKIIDHLLATPTTRGGPIELVRPKVLYQFADPKLESLSYGQKILLRIGGKNAEQLKTKLTQVRAELVNLNVRANP